MSGDEPCAEGRFRPHGHGADSLVLRRARILDVDSGQIGDPTDIAVVGGRIVEIGRVHTNVARVVIDVRGLTLLPGLIDCHVHVSAFSADLQRVGTSPAGLVAAEAFRAMRAMLERGFTSVRDAGGADTGLALAVGRRLVDGPRLLVAGPPICQTGGHADFRKGGDFSAPISAAFPCQGWVCDGPVEVLRASRELLRRGVDHIKVMLSGGIASPTDALNDSQFGFEEVQAAVGAAKAAGRYVMAHAYPAEAIATGLRAGVRSIEHGNFLDQDNIQAFLETGAFLVPTLVTYRALRDEGAECGLPSESQSKVERALEAGLESLERAARAGVRIAFGSDLLGPMRRRQSEEFMLRSAVQPPLEIVQAATIRAAELLGMDGEIGRVRCGFIADLIAVDGDPVGDVRLLGRPEETIQLVVARGEVALNRL